MGGRRVLCNPVRLWHGAAQPIVAAAVSGDIDGGLTALTGGFFSLAGRGTLKVIGGGLHEQRGYEGTAILVSRMTYDAGLTSFGERGVADYRDGFLRLDPEGKPVRDAKSDALILLIQKYVDAGDPVMAHGLQGLRDGCPV